MNPSPYWFVYLHWADHKRLTWCLPGACMLDHILFDVYLLTTDLAHSGAQF